MRLPRLSALVTALVILVVYVPASAESWQDLLSRADSLSKAQSQDSAIVIGRLALEKTQSQFGGNDTATARVLYRLGTYNYTKRSFGQADSLYHQALTIREEILGKDHPDVATAVSGLGILYMTQGRYADAGPLLKRALDIREKALGEDNADVGQSLNDLAVLSWYQGKLGDAELLFRRALAIREKALGPEHPDIGSTLNNIGILCFNQGRYAEAEPLFKRSRAIWEKALGPEHPNVAQSFNNLASLYGAQGKYAEAEPLLQRSLAIREKTLGQGNPKVAETLNNLGLLCYYEGEYATAEKHFRRALAINEKAQGPEHPDVAYSLANLSMLQWSQGRYDEATLVSQRALAIWEKAVGPDDPRVANCLNMLGVLLGEQRKYPEAESLMQRALAIEEKTLGPEHYEVGTGLYNIASLLAKQGKYAEAEPLYQRSLKIREKALGPGHPNVAYCLTEIATLDYYQGKYSEAEPLYQRSLAILEKAQGPAHPDVAATLESLSKLHRVEGKIALSFQESATALKTRLKHFQDNAYVLTEKDALKYSRSMRTSADNFLSTYHDFVKAGHSEAAQAAEIAVMTKGQVSDMIFERRKALVTETDSTTLALADSVRTNQFLLSKLYVSGPDEYDTSGTYRHKLDSLSVLNKRLESDLARESSSFQKFKSNREVTAAELLSLLPEKSMLVEYVKYNYLQLKPDSSTPRYLAVVFAPKREPVITDLGQAAEIESLVRRYREHMLLVSRANRLPTVVDLEDYRQVSTQLYDKIWRPIENQTRSNQEVFISPDDALTMVSFAGLPDPSGKYLTERFTIHYLSAGRDLIRLQEMPEASRGLLAMADPDFDALPASRVSSSFALQSGDTAATSYAMRSIRSSCGTLSESTADPLPGTRSEVQRIVSQWEKSSEEPVAVYYGAQASEDNFKSGAPGRRVIHLATHGYFLEGACQPEVSGGRLDEESGFVGENPLLMSGLLFAGANLHGEGADSARIDDGILTAFEVSGMNLQATQLVVLSACETGLGEVKAGEGVYGLRRAFQMAGARTVISSLWPVPDQATADVMSQLYGLSNKPIPERLRDLQLAQIKKLRAAGSPDHPFSWGAFIALGDWR